jgi:hypothetical protein
MFENVHKRGFWAFGLLGFAQMTERHFYCVPSGKYIPAHESTKSKNSFKLFLQEGELILQVFSVS